MKDEKDHGAGLIHPVASPLVETEPRPNIAEQFFSNMREQSILDDEVCQSLLAAFGHDNWEEFPWPFGGIVYDDYDGSFELRGLKSNDWTPTRDQIDAAFALGFDRCWICYPDGTESYHTRTESYPRRLPSSQRAQGDWSEAEAKLRKRIADLEAQIGSGNQAASAERADGTRRNQRVEDQAGSGLCHGGVPHYCSNCDRSFSAAKRTTPRCTECGSERLGYDSGEVPGQGVDYCESCGRAQVPESFFRIRDLEMEVNGWRELGEEMQRTIEMMIPVGALPDWFPPRLKEKLARKR